MMERVKTGIDGLDKLIENGLPSGSINLIAGPPGTGKSLFCLQFLYSGAINNEPGVYITSEQSKEDLMSNAKKIGLNIEPLIKKNKFVIFHENLNTWEQSMVDIDDLMSTIAEEIKKIKAKRLVIDSLSSMINVFTLGHLGKKVQSDVVEIGDTKLIPLIINESPIVRTIIWDIIEHLKKTGCTCLVTSEMPSGSKWLSRDTISEFTVDGVITLNKEVMGKDVSRSIIVQKMRNTAIKGGSYSLDISKKGLKVESKG